MPTQAKASLLVGIIFLTLTVINALLADKISPSFQRSEVLSGLSSVGLMLVAYLWSDASPKKANKKILDDEQGFILNIDSGKLDLRKELAWGSQMILTATPAASILIYWKDSIILHRGHIGKGEFKPGKICNNVISKQKILVMQNTKFYPGSYEFNSVTRNLPSILIQPLDKYGLMIVGGWSERCFSQSDERWIIGWSQKITEKLR